MSRWTLAAVGVVALAAALTALSSAFGYDREVVDMPVFALTALLVGSGLVFAMSVPRLIERSVPEVDARPAIMISMISVGLVARLILFASEPALEDDYQRYLWDGAVTASGLNPYSATPLAAQSAAPGSKLAQLRTQSGAVLDRVNHPQYATIYPPVTQAVFALTHALQPWSLGAWRALVLIFDGVIVACLIVLLRAARRTPLWAAFYWWNPLVLKEAFNSAHMEPLVVALVMMTVVLAVKSRIFGASAMLALATGAKLWPALLLPLIVRPLAGSPLKCATAVVVFAMLAGALLFPITAAGLGENSGLRAYAENWQTNSALFPMLKAVLNPAIVAFGGDDVAATLILKAFLGLCLVALAVAIARPATGTPQDLMVRAGVVIAALVLLSPAQYPWYVLWVLPFLAFWPSKAMLALTALVPLYYASFHFAARETLDSAGLVIVATIWLSVWALLTYELLQWRKQQPQTGTSQN